MLCLGFEPGAAGLQAQTDLLSYGSLIFATEISRKILKGLLNSLPKFSTDRGGGSEQCDQMARLFVEYLTIFKNENLHNNMRDFPKRG